MVKQFTIPCQFEGGQSSPVTLYIGHPEPTHHPLNWQSNWLGTNRGGQIPQELMDTIQKMHDLAQENNADFEEMCYYALISATNDQINGATSENINNFAQDFIAKEGNVETVKPANETTDNAKTGDGEQNTATTQPSEANKLSAEASKIDTTQKVAPTIGGGGANINTQTTQDSSINNNITETVDDTNNSQLNELTNNDGLTDVLNQLTQAQNDLQNLQQDTTNGFSQEDEDLLLNEDIGLLDDTFADANDLTNNTNQTNNTDEKTTADNSVYGDDDADLLED